MKKIVILTSTRAEYGLLAPIIKKMCAQKKVEVKVAVTGAHLSTDYGMTVHEVEEDGVPIDCRIDMGLCTETAGDISASMGRAMEGFGRYFEDSRPDALMVLGDRYETLAVCVCALNARIPIIHLHGGEATEGAIDESIRNAITKLSFLHFTSTDVYRKRVIQMGESPDRVYVSGAMGVENALQANLLTRVQLEQELGVSLGDNYGVLTFHPVTLENNTALNQVQELIGALDAFPDTTFLCTKANADQNGQLINRMLDEYAAGRDNVYLFDSLGQKKFLSALKYAKFAIGNSSSGIIEVPSFGIPTINIGDRQKGRIQATSVINCEPATESISRAIKQAYSEEFRNIASNTVNPYGDGHTSDMIVDITTDYLLNDKLKLQKPFFDM